MPGKIITCLSVCLIILSFSLPLKAEEPKIRIRSPQSELDKSHAYFASLLQLALDKTKGEYGSATVWVTNFNASQARVLKSLADNRFIDVEWAGTNLDREKILYPIRFPLVAGLTGWRIPIVRKDRLKEFEHIRTLTDFKKFTVVQGMHWPDADIMEASGIQVMRVATFEQIYPALFWGRADCSPRGLQAVTSELQGKVERDFTAVMNLIIKYPFPMYFFTSLDKACLGARIEKGLINALNDGSFLKHMQTHPVTKSIFPLSRFENATFINLSNPFLPPGTPDLEPSSWLKAP